MSHELNGYYVESKWGWRDRLRWRLFPQHPCPAPDPIGIDGDVLICKTCVQLVWADRARLLITGKLTIETMTAVGVKVGPSRATSIANVVTRFDNPRLSDD